MNPKILRLVTLTFAFGFSALLPAQTPASDLPAASNPPRPAVAPLDPKLPTIFVAGDSTAARGRGEGQQGWGVPLADYFDLAKVNVANRARGGTSSRTFISAGNWERIIADAKAGDFVLIQIGTNDGGALNDEPPPPLRARGTIPGIGEETKEIDNVITKKHEVVHTYGWYLRQMISEAKAKKLTPILIAQPLRNVWKDGKIERGAGNYSQWAREVAQATDVPFLELANVIADQLESQGEEALKAKIYQQDHTHYNAIGADLHAAAIVSGLKKLKGNPFGEFLSAKGKELPAAPVKPAVTAP